jgi:antitoxin Phd
MVRRRVVRSWQVQEAKAKFSDLLRAAAKSGPQRITVRGEAAAVVLSNKEYERLRARKPSLVAFLRASPLAGIDWKITRDRSSGRAVKL